MGYFVCYNKTMRKFKSSSKSNSSRKKYVIKKNNILFEDKTSPNATFKIIVDEKEPFYKHTRREK